MNAMIDETQLPIQKPENYDFSVKNLNWKKYENDYLLRTDAVWEKSKLKAYFYSLYKAVNSLILIFYFNHKGTTSP